MGVRKKLETSSPRLLNSWLLFVTALIIVLAILFYSLVYVKNNEEKQIAKRFRVLAQIGKNIVDREAGFRGIAKRKGEEKEDESLTQEMLEKRLTNVKNVLKIAEKKKAPKTGALVFDTIKVVINKDKDVTNFVIYANVKDLFDPLKRPGVFDELILLADKDSQTKTGETRTGTGQSENDVTKREESCPVIYHTFPGELDLSEINKLKSLEFGIESGNLKDIKISNRDYKLFLQPIRTNGGEKWYVGGLVGGSKFKKETRALKSGVVIPFLIVFIILILGIPLLKLFLMSTFEQLNIKDAVLVSVSINFGIVLLVFLYLFVYQTNHDAYNIKKNLRDLAEQIETEFVEELGDAYAQLNEYETLFDGYGYKLETGDNINSILAEPAFEGKETSKTVSPDLKIALRPTVYNQFKLAFWMDDRGQQKAQFSTRNYAGGMSKLAHRSYFRDAGNWRLPGEPNKRFMLESIISVTTGEKLAAISRESDFELKDNDAGEKKVLKCKVAAMTTQLTSLIDTIMPVGYGFCVIDETGEVWFHSNKERNHQENFIHEVEMDSEFMSAVFSKQKTFIDLDYQNKDHKCYVTPVPDIPLFVVTFHDMAYANSVLTYTFLYTFILIFFLSLFNGLLFAVAACARYRESLLKRKYVPFDWLGPLKERPETYQYLTVSNLIIIAVLIISSNFTGGAGTFFICILACLVSFVYNYYTINGEEWENRRLIVKPLLKDLRENKRLKRVPHLRSYLCFLLSWLVLVSVIPVVMFYIDAYNHENEIALKHVQVTFAKDIEERDSRIETFYKEKMAAPGNKNDNEEDKPGSDNLLETTKEDRKRMAIYLPVIRNTHILDATERENPVIPAEKAAGTFFAKIVYLLKPSLDRIAEEKRGLVFQNPPDSGRAWWKKEDKLYLKYQIGHSLYKGEAGDKKDIVIRSQLKYSKILEGISFPVLAIAVFIALVFAYFLIRFSVRMIFGLKLLHLLKPLSEFETDIRNHIAAGSDLIVYCQTVKQMDYCISLFSEGKEDAGSTNSGKLPIMVDEITDLDSPEKKTAKASGTDAARHVLIKDFEFDFNDIDKNLRKMTQVKELLISQEVQVVIPTFIPLNKMLEHCRERLAGLSEDSRKMKEDARANDAAVEELNALSKKYNEMIELLNTARERWVALYVPLQTVKGTGHESSEKGTVVYPYVSQIESNRIRRLIRREFEGIENCKDLGEIVFQYYTALRREKDPRIEEKIILKIQSLAEPYYHRLLKSCTNKEKYLLYDIAVNMLVNSNNLETQLILARKGLIVCNGTCRLMNESFRNFILSTIDPEKAKHFMNELSAKGKWRSYKAPLVLIVLGLVVFLALQDNLLSNVNAILTTVIGGLALLTKLSGFLTNFSSGGSK